MLRIQIKYTFDGYTMFKDVIAGILAGSYDLDVNNAGTKVTVLDLSGGSNTNLTIVGTGLTLISNLSLAGGHVTGFGYHDANTYGPQADISGVNLGALALQGLIDAATSVTQLQDALFDNRPQVISGGPYPNYIQGGHADDKIYGNGGDDYIFASEGNDVVYGGGGIGIDTLDFSRVADLGGVNMDLKAHTASIGKFHQTISGFEIFVLTDNGDSVAGDKSDDSLSDGTGNDVISGRGGDDTLVGNAGNDVIHGDSGNDSIQGDLDSNSNLHGKDRIFGGAGNDTIEGNSGLDVIHGGRDNDFILGNNGNDVIDGNSGADGVYGGFGHDAIFGGAGKDYLDGGRATLFESDTPGLTPGHDVRDTISGGANADRIFGRGGGDLLKGDGGNDHLHGNAGDDTLFGGSGKDHLRGDGGDDHLIGGKGADTFFFVGTTISGNDTIEDLTGADVVDLYDQLPNFVSIGQSGHDATISYSGGVITVLGIDHSLLTFSAQPYDTEVLIHL